MISIKKKTFDPTHTYMPRGDGTWDNENPKTEHRAVLYYTLYVGQEAVLEGESPLYDPTGPDADNQAYLSLKEELAQLVAAVLDVPMEEARELLPYYHEENSIELGGFNANI
ncbi:MAG: hypothetical protein LC687_00165 [Actinobacteria bacterium]|nr:hypothetical protein [Actinomycetota bacterium]MCA1806284.1 hypothetical protein [Actinomycetota bacterium]